MGIRYLSRTISAGQPSKDFSGNYVTIFSIATLQLHCVSFINGRLGNTLYSHAQKKAAGSTYICRFRWPISRLGDTWVEQDYTTRDRRSGVTEGSNSQADAKLWKSRNIRHSKVRSVK